MKKSFLMILWAIFALATFTNCNSENAPSSSSSASEEEVAQDETPSSAPAYNIYHNTKYYFSVEYDQTFFTEALPSHSGDGCTFSDPDETCTMRAYHSVGHMDDDFQPLQLDAAYQKDLQEGEVLSSTLEEENGYYRIDRATKGGGREVQATFRFKPLPSQGTEFFELLFTFPANKADDRMNERISHSIMSIRSILNEDMGVLSNGLDMYMYNIVFDNQNVNDAAERTDILNKSYAASTGAVRIIDGVGYKAEQKFGYNKQEGNIFVESSLYPTLFVCQVANLDNLGESVTDGIYYAPCSTSDLPSYRDAKSGDSKQIQTSTPEEPLAKAYFMINGEVWQRTYWILEQRDNAKDWRLLAIEEVQFILKRCSSFRGDSLE